MLLCLFSNGEKMLNIEQAMQEGGSFAVIRNRLLNNASDFKSSIVDLDEKRKVEFGGVALDVLTNVNLLTGSNCKPVDIAKVGDVLLFGFDSEIGMKSRTVLSDLLATYELVANESGGFEVHQLDLMDTFLSSQEFNDEFSRLTEYNRNFRLRQLFVENDTLYMIVSTDPDGVEFAHFTFVNGSSGFEYKGYQLYLPSRGERFAPNWVKTTNSDIVKGRHPHISVLNKVFVETVGGDLTIKTESNTEDGRGIYAEDVVAKEQRITDAEVYFVDMGDLIALSIKPLSEEPRYFIYNVPTQKVIRCDAIADGFTPLESEGGVIFSNGYAIAGGDMKVFDAEDTDSRYHAHTVSPSGEDVLYAFYNIAASTYTIYHYNLVNKKVAPPIHSNGFTSRKDGKLLVFRSSQNSKAEKLHKLQVWHSPFMSQEKYAELQSGKADTPLTRVGNPSLVAGISDCYSVLELCASEEISEALYETILVSSDRLVDSHYWLTSEDFGAPAVHVSKLREAAEQVLSEFKKVKELSAEATALIEELNERYAGVQHQVNTLVGNSPQPYIESLHSVKVFIGSVVAAKDRRYIDVERLDQILDSTAELKDRVVEKLIQKLQDKQSFGVFFESLRDIEREARGASTSKKLDESISKLTETSESLQSLSSEVNELDSDDSTQITAIITNLGDVFTEINALNAKLSSSRKSMVEEELRDQFSAQMIQVSQVIEVALASANTPSQCEEQAQELSAQFEKLELRFAESDEYLDQVRSKCSDALQSLETKKESLQSEIQSKIQRLADSADVSIQSVEAKVNSFDSIEQVHTFFQSNILVERLMTNLSRIVDMGDSVLADSYKLKIKMLRAEAITSTRDRAELFEKGGSIIKLGKHRFSVNTRNPEFSIVDSAGAPIAVVSSTSFKQALNDDRFDSLSDYFGRTVPTESDVVYRGSYLAFLVIKHIKENGYDVNGRADAMVDEWRFDKTDTLDQMIDEVLKKNYDGGFTRGVHDVDAKAVFMKIYPMLGGGDSGVFASSETRQMALTYLLASAEEHGLINKIIDRLNLARDMAKVASLRESGAANLAAIEAVKSCYLDVIKHHKLAQRSISLIPESGAIIGSDSPRITERLLGDVELEVPNDEIISAVTDYLVACLELADGKLILILPKEVSEICEAVNEQMPENLRDGLSEETFDILVEHMFENMAQGIRREAWLRFKLGATGDSFVKYEQNSTQFSIDGLIGDHPTLNSGVLSGDVEQFMNVCEAHYSVHAAKYLELVQLRQTVSKEMQESLRLNELQPKPMAGFVRNELIKKCYLPMVGDSFASQIGTIDSSKAGQSGGLLLMSPPGYGKTTLLEYLAKAMGMLFVKVNGPAIGHNVTSIIPEEADSAAAQSELEKLNFALEMGDNVLVVVDDIQHLNPEFLQKFISLCDGTRRIEGKWNGVTKTYDLKGKRFAIAMAGNPYTENGEAFKVPDMLSNRMSSYNLGDVMSGMEIPFELSYIENCLTANPVTEVLSSREPEDVLTIIKMARGDMEVAASALKHPYSQGELAELVDVMAHMVSVQKVVLEVNKRYIESAAQATNYRTEPPFLLQGSYRNMAKMAEKVVGAMTDEDIRNLISDHYKAESQTLTVGAEENFLRIKFLLGTSTKQDEERWSEIVEKYKEMMAPDVSSEAESLKDIADVLSKLVSQSK